MMALTVAFVSETVPKEKTGSAMGLLGTMSAIGTTLGPSLGGVLMTGLGWRAIFLVNIPLGIVNYFLAHRYLPHDRQHAAPNKARFDIPGTVLLALCLAAYALAMTMGRGHFDRRNAGLLSLALLFALLFVYAEKRVKAPLIHLAMFGKAELGAALAMNALVSAVMMATLVVGPFYLSRGLGLTTAIVGLVLSLGPMISAGSGLVAGRIVDKLGAPKMMVAGLAEMLVGALGLALLPTLFGLVGYVAAIAVLTPGYQLFQAANNTRVMQDVQADQRGLISGMLSLSRNLGLISGAALMGAVFAFACGADNVSLASPASVSAGMRATFLLAAAMMTVALIMALHIYRQAWRNQQLATCKQCTE